MVLSAQYTTIGFIAAGVISLVSLILAFVALSSTSSLKKKFKKWKGIHSTADLEEVYARTLDAVADLRQQLAAAEEEVSRLQEAVKTKIATAKVLRYNAFHELGSDLSFSVALLDEEQNGVVLSSIYGRDESRTYAKPVVHGNSSYALTDEEQEVIGRSFQKSGEGRRKPVHV
ncbi:DUF4446 family protein [Alicyclobacillus tolerans]|uniref:DUF4446 family protein n=1 Tax=Alicyclobacillus tolerans TaxID=90970 RepID=UPI001F352FBB|nr:DUF4446 family protein [Alicyclobacillus tolerans]MCF8565700.1 DUF4446 family protein [Alicyclobacillus tolerans]